MGYDMGLATISLEKLPVISLDLETTGLRPKTDRVVQIGAADPFDESWQMDMLVNPGIAIPPLSTAIHHISDDDVAAAPQLPSLLPRLREAISAKVVIGYNIGFDLSVLQAEAERHGLEWQPPPALCLRQLAGVVLGDQTMLMLGDLQALAVHYGVSEADRHTALGDALMTGRIYKKMIADLNARSVLTLGDAWRAVAGLDDMRLQQVRAGWVDVAAASYQPVSMHPLARIDPYPYQHRIYEMMRAAPVIMSPDCTVLAAASRMREDRLDCIFVGSGPDDIAGIVSERDIVHAMATPLSQVKTARDISLRTIMSTPVITVRDQDFMYVGLGRIGRHDVRHLGVTDARGALIGWLSLRELMRQRLRTAVVIGDRMSSAQSAPEMKEALQELPFLATSLLSDGVAALAIAAVISNAYRTALQQAARLAEQQMRANGDDMPCSYVLLVLGSAGRGESLLAADQDHAIIYSDEGADSKEYQRRQRWFETLGGLISDSLDAAGIPYCKGRVMSSQPQWCRSVSGWVQAVQSWIGQSRPQDILNVDIFFDFAPVHGDLRLCTELEEKISPLAVQNRGFLKMLARNTAGATGGLTVFGSLKTQGGRFNIKLYMLLPLTETLRVLALSRALDERSSAERARALLQLDDVPPEIGGFAEDIHFCLKLVLRQQIKDISAGLPPVSAIEETILQSGERQLLKAIQNRIRYLEPLIQACLFAR